MIRVLFVMTDLAGGGAEPSLLELLGRLARSKFAVSLFLLRRTGVYLDRVPPNVRICWGSSVEGSLRSQCPSIATKVLEESARADVIVGAMEMWPSYFAWFGAALHNKPLVCWVRTELDIYLKPFARWHVWLSRVMYPRCHAVVVPSQGSLNSICRLAAIRPDRLKVIHNMVDPAEVRRLAVEPLPEWFLAAGTKPFILAVGRLHIAHKGYDLLIRAHAAVRSRNVDHHLVILGEGPDRAVLEHLADTLGVTDSVFMPGFQRNPFPFYKAATALAMPARVDGLARVLLEASILGTPMIASGASGPSEVLDNGLYGLPIKTDSSATLADSMFVLLTDASTRADYARRALLRAQHFSPELAAEKWSSLLCSL